jgi:hypothetical protein
VASSVREICQLRFTVLAFIVPPIAGKKVELWISEAAGEGKRKQSMACIDGQNGPRRMKRKDAVLEGPHFSDAANQFFAWPTLSRR